MIRGIEISGIDIQACGGTRVRSTGEIGRFRIQKVDNKGANLRRIKIILG
jgi:Ser-tRNA(Ala) deacylase AlaX